MKKIAFIIVLFIYHLSFSQQDSTMIYIYKVKGSGGGKTNILINGRLVHELKTGQKIAYKVYSEGVYNVSIDKKGSVSGNKGVSFSVIRGYNYYIKLYTTETYEMLLMKENKYTGDRVIKDASLFCKKDCSFTFEENLDNPFVEKGVIAHRSGGLFINGEVGKTPQVVLPKVEVIQPSQTESGEVFMTDQKTIIVKGKVTEFDKVQAVTVNGIPASINTEGYFTCEVTLPKYMENKISIMALTKSNNFVQKEFKVYRNYTKVQEGANKRAGKDYALIIATDTYNEYNNLRNPIFDATRINKELNEIYGFETEFIKDPSLNQLYLQLKKYSKREFADDDQLFIFIAGHGEFDKYFRDGYIVCKDSKLEDESKSSFMSHSNLRTIINNIPCKHVFLVMDVCFGGTFDQFIAQRGNENYKGMDNSEFINRKLKYRTRIYLTSGGKEYVPDGRPGHHSPFAHNFIEALSSGGGEDNILTVSELMRYVEKTIPEPRKGGFGSNQPGSDFLFIVK